MNKSREERKYERQERRLARLRRQYGAEDRSPRISFADREQRREDIYDEYAVDWHDSYESMPEPLTWQYGQSEDT